MRTFKDNEKRITFVAEYSHSYGEKCTKHIQKSNSHPQGPVIFTLSAFISLLDTCNRKKYNIFQNKEIRNKENRKIIRYSIKSTNSHYKAILDL